MRLAIASFVLLGCTPVDTEPSEPPIKPFTCTKPQIAGGLTAYDTCDGTTEQGRHVLGIPADTLATNNTHVSIAAGAIGINDHGVLNVNGTPIVLPQDFPASGGITLHIEGPTSTPSPTLAGYIITYQLPNTTSWLPYCSNGEPAIAMEGVWTTTGLHNRPMPPTAPPRLTFACDTEGKAGKCELWGYVPGTAQTTSNAGIGEQGWDMNQSCTQMATANYCMNGVSHTREKTPIVIRDLIPNYGQPDFIPGDPETPRLVPDTYPPVPPPPDEFFVEALFPPRGVVKCLSKLRWNDQPPGGPCGVGSELKDPRSDPAGVFCEDLIPTLDLNSSAYAHNIIDASLTMDLALHRWNDGTGQTLTTVHGYVAPLGNHPPTGYTTLMTNPNNEGFLLRNRTGTLSPDDVIEVFRLTNGNGDEVVAPEHTLESRGFGRTSTALAPDAPDFEGYLLKPSVADPNKTLPFTLYHNESSSDFVTSAVAPNGIFQQYFIETSEGTNGVLGYVIRGAVSP